jgi:citrate lyase subunit alpha/citrate CoA-transferase
VDVGFNVNANTHSDGRLLHGIGGHQDTAQAASLTIVAVPLARKQHPIVREKVTTVTTPGNVVDAVVTEIGIAVNPDRRDLLDALEGKLPLLRIEDMKAEAYAITGKPRPPQLADDIVGLVTWIDGTLLDIIWRAKEQDAG